MQSAQAEAPVNNSAAPQESQESIDSKGNDIVGSTGLVLQDTYTLGPCIGQGGMGEVYEATHVRLPGRMAVKILRQHLLTNQDAFARFCREAEIMSSLRHPHIIQIFDFNTSLDGLPYFVMEYLDGVDLETRLADSGPLALAAVVRIVDAVASALGAAHALGIVHRDLKPANIFLTRGEGQDHDFVKVIDFGISTSPRSVPRLSRVSEVMGTPEFMAPEQALGLGQIDARTDQFALASITYAMLTGRGPFVGNHPASLLYQVVHEQQPLLAGFLPWDATEIQAVMDRALAKRQEDRFDSIVDFAGAFATAARSVIRESVSSAAIPLPVLSPVPTSPVTPPPVRLDDWQARAQRPRVTPSTARRVEAVGEVDLPRSLDRVPRGPQRAVALGLGVLGLAAAIVYNGWYRGFPRNAANLEQDLVGLVRAKWRALSPGVPASAIETTKLVTVPSELAPPSEPPRPLVVPLPAAEQASDIVAAADDPTPESREASAQAERAPARPAARHHHRRASSRSGWQTIELSYHAPLAPSEAAAAAPAQLTSPDAFSIPPPAALPPARDLAPAPAASE
jgi:serine/threonine-protein kinase